MNREFTQMRQSDLLHRTRISPLSECLWDPSSKWPISWHLQTMLIEAMLGLARTGFFSLYENGV